MMETKGEILRLKDHLAGICKNIAPYKQVTDKVKEKIQNYLKLGVVAKQPRKQSFENIVDDGVYFGRSPSHEI